MQADSPCPCCSGKAFGECCGPLLSGKAQAKTPRQLMRSRYTAYALGNHGDYLLATWHPADGAAIQAADFEAAGITWTGLEILSAEQKGNAGQVIFRASFLDEQGEPRVHQERSFFLRSHNRWYFVSGEIYADGDNAAGEDDSGPV